MSDEFLEEECFQINEIEISSKLEYEDASLDKPTPEINMLIKEEEFLLSITNKITYPEGKKEYLDRLQSLMNITSKPNTSYNLKDIFNRDKKKRKKKEKETNSGQ